MNPHLRRIRFWSLFALFVIVALLFVWLFVLSGQYIGLLRQAMLSLAITIIVFFFLAQTCERKHIHILLGTTAGLGMAMIFFQTVQSPNMRWISGIVLMAILGGLYGQYFFIQKNRGTRLIFSVRDEFQASAKALTAAVMSAILFSSVFFFNSFVTAGKPDTQKIYTNIHSFTKDINVFLKTLTHTETNLIENPTTIIASKLIPLNAEMILQDDIPDSYRNNPQVKKLLKENQRKINRFFINELLTLAQVPTDKKDPLLTGEELIAYKLTYFVSEFFSLVRFEAILLAMALGYTAVKMFLFVISICIGVLFSIFRKTGIYQTEKQLLETEVIV